MRKCAICLFQTAHTGVFVRRKCAMRKCAICLFILAGGVTTSHVEATAGVSRNLTAEAWALGKAADTTLMLQKRQKEELEPGTSKMERPVHGKQRASKRLAGVPFFRAKRAHAVADQWMVSFGNMATNADLEAFCSQSGPCKYMGHPDEGGIPFVVVKASEKMLGSSIARARVRARGRAAHLSSVALVEQDAEVDDFVDEGSAPESSRLSQKRWWGPRPWGLKAVGVPTSKKGKGVNVYVLDTGVRVTHNEFGGRAIPLYDASKHPPKVCDRSDTSCAADDRGHGTHVAGTVGGKKTGVAPKALIWAMQFGRVMSDGYGGIDWLVQKQNREAPAVLQMSWGLKHNDHVSPTAEAAVDAAVAAMITVVVSAGNDNQDACHKTFGGISSAITVASTTAVKRRSYFSNFGPCVDIFAPGSQIRSASHLSDTGLAVKSGTSMASPHVAGAAALVLESSPRMSPAEVLRELQSNSLKDYVKDAKSDNNNFLWVRGKKKPARWFFR